MKGLIETVASDPLIYRFYEIMRVYVLPLKDIIQENLAMGMSAIDFTMDVDKEKILRGAGGAHHER